MAYGSASGRGLSFWTYTPIFCFSLSLLVLIFIFGLAGFLLVGLDFVLLWLAAYGRLEVHGGRVDILGGTRRFLWRMVQKE